MPIKEHPRVSVSYIATLLRNMADALEAGKFGRFRRQVGILWRILAEWGELP